MLKWRRGIETGMSDDGRARLHLALISFRMGTGSRDKATLAIVLLRVLAQMPKCSERFTAHCEYGCKIEPHVTECIEGKPLIMMTACILQNQDLSGHYWTE
jgi:hypothetical protein